MPTTQSKIKREVENKLVRLLRLKKDEEPSDKELKILGITIKFLAVSAKLSEEEYGADLNKLIEEGGDDENESEIDP